jgi:hypothetical protein
MLQNDPLRLPHFHFDAVPDPDPAFHFIPDPDPGPVPQEDHVGHQSLVEYSYRRQVEHRFQRTRDRTKRTKKGTNRGGEMSSTYLTE